MSKVHIKVPVPWSYDPLTVVGDVYDGEFEFEEAYFPYSVFIFVDKLPIPMADFIMDSVYKQLEKRDE